MTEITYTRGQVTVALGTAHGQLDEVTDTGPVDALTVDTWARLGKLGSGPFTYDQVASALSEAANELDETVEYEDSDTIWAQDVRNLAVNAALYQLRHPGASLREAIAAAYRDSSVDEVLGWVS